MLCGANIKTMLPRRLSQSRCYLVLRSWRGLQAEAFAAYGEITQRAGFHDRFAWVEQFVGDETR